MSPGREGDISKCPVVHGKGAGNGGGGLMGIFGTPKSTTPNEDGGAAGAGATTGKAAGCPVMVGGKTASTDGGAGNAAETPAPTFNEYGEQVDPRNQMPTGNQEPWPGQQQRLSTERVQSAIPKGKSEGESGETWTYPSPQQFYNALKRKGKGADVSEEQVDTLVSIHNNMNDVTWQLLLEWEQWHINRKAVADDTPRLAKFMGRPFDLTPKARIKSWLGYGLPFDRHDWEVDRGMGKGATRYVIDYYYDNSKSEQDTVPQLGVQASASDIKSIVVDVRPALDSLESVYHRLRRFPARAYQAFQRGAPAEPDMAGPGTGYEKEAAEKKDRISALAAAAGPAVASAEAAVGTEQDDDPEIARLQSEVDDKCGALFGAVAASEDEQERAQTTMALHYCVSSVVCPPTAVAFMSALEQNADVGEGVIEAASDEMSTCVEAFFQKCRGVGLASVAAAQPGAKEGITLRSDLSQ